MPTDNLQVGPALAGKVVKNTLQASVIFRIVVIGIVVPTILAISCIPILISMEGQPYGTVTFYLMAIVAVVAPASILMTLLWGIPSHFVLVRWRMTSLKWYIISGLLGSIILSSLLAAHQYFTGDILLWPEYYFAQFIVLCSGPLVATIVWVNLRVNQ